jgi:PTS system nitrogen regulatory IIA component
MNPIGELLAVDDIELDLDVPDKEALLGRIADMLSRHLGLSRAQVLENLTLREQLGSTGLGHGVAIPHARMTECYAAACALVRTKAAIAFDAPDGKPVSLFLGLVVPKEANERHLKLLGTAAAMFNDRALRDKLRTCTDRNIVRQLLVAWPDLGAPVTAGP